MILTQRTQTMAHILSHLVRSKLRSNVTGVKPNPHNTNTILQLLMKHIILFWALTVLPVSILYKMKIFLCHWETSTRQQNHPLLTLLFYQHLREEIITFLLAELWFVGRWKWKITGLFKFLLLGGKNQKKKKKQETLSHRFLILFVVHEQNEATHTILNSSWSKLRGRVRALLNEYNIIYKFTQICAQK